MTPNAAYCASAVLRATSTIRCKTPSRESSLAINRLARSRPCSRSCRATTSEARDTNSFMSWSMGRPVIGVRLPVPSAPSDWPELTAFFPLPSSVLPIRRMPQPHPSPVPRGSARKWLRFQ